MACQPAGCKGCLPGHDCAYSPGFQERDQAFYWRESGFREEASRALILLDGSFTAAHEALKKSNRGIMKALMSCETPTRVRGFYCCGTCTAALWRHLAVGGLKQSKRRLSAGLKVLKKYRDGAGKWRRFPFYYTLLALSEIGRGIAIDELHYTAPLCERLLKRYKARNKLAKRRRRVMEKVLAEC
jgi:hypothetical protein